MAVACGCCLGQSAITVSTESDWVDTKMDLTAGETIRITAEGSIGFEGKKQVMPADPAGLARSIRDVIKNYSVNEAGLGALIARIGDGEGIRPFLIGAKWEGRVPVSGRLFLGVNRSDSERGEGSFKATIARLAAAPKVTAPASMPTLSQERLNEIPRRVQDATGSAGDRVNFVLIGSKARVQEALKQAGWVVVDKDVANAVMQGILNTIQKRSYVTMPMSELELFGRSQDFGYAQGDPLKVVASRHHFRIWQAPFDLEGLTVWAGAGTHDIGFDKDQRNNGLTHKIDPDVDLEREHIAASLRATGLVVKTEYLTPSDAVKTAKTAHGEEFHSDGRTLIIYLLPEEKTESTDGALTPQ